MGTKKSPANSGPNVDPDKTTIQVITTKKRKQQFGAACRLKGRTIQEFVNAFMDETVSNAGIRPDGPT